MPRFTPGLWRRALLVGAILSPVGFILTCDSSRGRIGTGLSGLLYVMAGGTVVAAVVLAVEGWARRRFHRPGAASPPSFGFVAWGLLPTFFALLSLGSGPVRPAEITLGSFALAWWVVGILLVRGVGSAILPALALVAVPWCLVVAQAVRRVAFIIREGGMERADGLGSPLLFLFNWVIELSVAFVPLTLIGIKLARAFRRERYRSTDMTLESPPRPSR